MTTITIVVPDKIGYIANDLRRFVDAMVFKLHQNAHKGRWEERTVGEVLEMLEEEVSELDEAISEGNTVEVLLECSDVANMALILASIFIDKGNAPHSTLTDDLEAGITKATRDSVKNAGAKK